MARHGQDRQRQHNVRRTLRLARRSASFVASVGRREFWWSAFLQMATGSVGLVQLLLGRELLGEMLVDGKPSLNRMLPPAATLVAVTLIERTITAMHGQRTALLEYLVGRRAVARVLDVAQRVPLEHFETPLFYDQLERSLQDGSTRPYGIVVSSLDFVRAVTGSVSLAVGLWLVHPALVLYLLGAQLPLLLLRQRVGLDSYEFYVRWTTNRRRRDYLEDVLTGRGEAKEIRAFGSAPMFLRMWAELHDQYLAGMREFHRRRARTSIAGGAVSAAVILAGAGLTTTLWQWGRIPLQGAVVALAGLTLIGRQFESLVRSASDMHDEALFLQEFDEFTALPGSDDASGEEPTDSTFEVLSLRGVSFTYPSAPRPAVKDVDLEIPAGQTLALVGENGSGKTTLAKLIAGLYTPTEGEILRDGRSLANAPVASLRRWRSVIFQDFVRYRLTAADNIGVGDVDTGTIEAIRRASERAGISQALDALPDGLATPLTKDLEGGVELSGGEWQRLAIARATVREAPLVILDEPTAALDPLAEHALFQQLRTALRGQTVVLISHRLASVKDADRILVMDQGRIAESGTHDELLRRGGRYAKMFTVQAGPYR